MNTSLAYLLGKLMFEIDRAADKLLQTHVGISYKRALFLIVLQHCGTVTQHELAVAPGYSDPAVSMMPADLVKEGYVQTSPSATHARKRLGTITPKGRDADRRGRELLDGRLEH